VQRFIKITIVGKKIVKTCDVNRWIYQKNCKCRLHNYILYRL